LSDAGIDGAVETNLSEITNEACDIKGEKGQGNSLNPPSRFTGHFIFTASTNYYDPSYGLGGFCDRKKYEDCAFSGTVIGVDGNEYLLDLPSDDHDGNSVTDEVGVYR